MHVIRNREGDIIRRSRNLRGFVTHLGKTRSPVKMLDIGRLAEGGGRLCVLWENGDSYETNFASIDVLTDWVFHRRNLRGSPYSLNGIPAGHL